MSSIFTRIINGEIPCTKVYEDDKCLAFLDINPITKGHTLLIPKEEYVWMTDVPDELIAHLFQKTKWLMQEMKKNLNVDYVHINIEGIDVPHFHIHLIPNMAGNKIASFVHTTYHEGEAAKIAKQITHR